MVLCVQLIARVTPTGVLNTGEVEVRGKQVDVRIQRRVRMGMKDELGPPHILSSPSGHMTICLYLFGSLHFLICPFEVYPVLRSLPECSDTRVKG